MALAVDHLCAYCAEQWKDYLHARAGQREADHRSQQLGLELKHAEGYNYLDQPDLDALAAEADRGERLVDIRTVIAENTADRVAEAIADCVRCRDLVEVLFPEHVEVEL
ncbi:hypothetical protein [Tsukamurella strandjordii]|uniref:Uncharacterized protein n=1 Tax=Tsukamurella strandjordii TaxID=147577 RepID=A0AA90SRA2_9ACTN|nr:hypothetical protein [Tsukamurella strandjordii]MDP0398751.1 hypothetical protein [Tsukamurella strandjordii]